MPGAGRNHDAGFAVSTSSKNDQTDNNHNFGAMNGAENHSTTAQSRQGANMG
jgi:hypothetical protein